LARGGKNAVQETSKGDNKQTPSGGLEGAGESNAKKTLQEGGEDRGVSGTSFKAEKNQADKGGRKRESKDSKLKQ